MFLTLIHICPNNEHNKGVINEIHMIYILLYHMLNKFLIDIESIQVVKKVIESIQSYENALV